MSTAFQAHGVIPATLLAFRDDHTIDARATRSHIADVAAVDGVTGIVVNGHASEVHACSFDEQRQLLDIAVDQIAATCPVIAGIYAEGSLEAGRLARSAAKAGASALLVFPSAAFTMDGVIRPEMVRSHFQCIADQTDLPIILFQYAASSPVGYSFDLMSDLLDTFPQIVAIKDFCCDGQRHERHIRELPSRERPVTVFTSHSGWLLGSLAMGAGGIISGAGSVIASLQVELYRAVRRDDMASARAVADRIYLATQAFYHAPAIDMHNRMKEALVLQGKLDKAVVRPPLAKLSASEISGIRHLLDRAGLLTPTAATEGR